MDTKLMNNSVVEVDGYACIGDKIISTEVTRKWRNLTEDVKFFKIMYKYYLQ